jgi:adenosine deaminase
MPIQPFVEMPIDLEIARLPKADLHLHQEEIPRLERLVARRKGRLPYDWRAWEQHLVADLAPGTERFLGSYAPDETFALDDVPGAFPEWVVAKMADALADAAADGAVLAEVRFGMDGLALRHGNFMGLFREAERQVQAQYPGFCGEAIVLLGPSSRPDRLDAVERTLERCLDMRREGLGGIDFVVSPYTTEAPPDLWARVTRWAARAAEAGLGITIHAGEFSRANLSAALRVPGLRRIGHGVHVVDETRLLDQLAQSGATVECSLSCNLVLGAVPSYEAHPIRRLVDAGIPLTLNTDNPLRSWTTIGREYAIAAELGFSASELVGFTRNAIEASFTTAARKTGLMEQLGQNREAT